LAEACRLVPVELDVTSARFERGEYLAAGGAAPGAPPPAIAYVCLDDDSRGLSAALVVARNAAGRPLPVVVRMSYETGLASLAVGQGAGFEHLHGFGVISWVCQPDRLFAGTHETLARAIHADYVATRRRLGDTEAGNAALVDWER